MNEASCRSSRLRVGLLVPLLVSLLLGACTEFRNEIRSGPVAEEAVPGHFYFATQVEVDRFSMGVGAAVERDDVTDAELAAACQVWVDWNGDYALSKELGMMDNPGLLRSAELLAGEFSESQVAREVEAHRDNGDDETLIVDEILQSDGAAAADEARRYLDARRLPPSASAAENFVVYFAPKTTTKMLVVRMAIKPLAQPWPGLSNQDVTLLRLNGEIIEIDAHWCLEGDE